MIFQLCERIIMYAHEKKILLRQGKMEGSISKCLEGLWEAKVDCRIRKVASGMSQPAWVRIMAQSPESCVVSGKLLFFFVFIKPSKMSVYCF